MDDAKVVILMGSFSSFVVLSFVSYCIFVMKTGCLSP